MKKDIFLIEISKILDHSGVLEMNQKLNELDSFDSLTKMAISAWIGDDFGMECNLSDVNEFQTVEDIFNFIK